MVKYRNVKPSLSINVTDKCNFNCIYCPPNGENLTACNKKCSINNIIALIELANKYNLPVVRLTGGEPLLNPQKVYDILKKCKQGRFKKVILNTNGYYIRENIEWLKKFKENILLKISLDSLSEDMFNTITNTKDKFIKVQEGLMLSKSIGMKIEINSVVTKINYGDILEIIKFAKMQHMNVKLFGINDFGGAVSYNNLHQDLTELVDLLSLEYKRCEEEGLPGNRGIKMLKYKLTEDNYIYITEHAKNSIFNTGKKTYSKDCKDCKEFPCSTGKFSITLRADGLLQGCRLRPEKGVDIEKSTNIEKSFLKILEEYENCIVI